MRIFRALKTNLLTQRFNENGVDIYAKWGMTCHGGYDFSAQDGEKIYFDCSCSGIVLNTEIDNNGGLGVNIITETSEGIYKHRYWHLKEFKVVAGQKVDTGDLIGLADNTGYSTATHLHRDIKEMIKENGVYLVKNPNNGTKGTIDYWPLFSNIFVKDYMDILQAQVNLIQSIIDKIKEFLKGR